MLDILNGMVGQIWRMLGACRRGCQVKTNSCWQQPALICTFAGRGKRSRVCSFVDWKVLNLPLNVFFLITAGLGLEGAKQLWCRPLSRSLNPLQTYKYVRDSSMHIFFQCVLSLFFVPLSNPKTLRFRCHPVDIDIGHADILCMVRFPRALAHPNMPNMLQVISVEWKLTCIWGGISVGGGVNIPNMELCATVSELRFNSDLCSAVCSACECQGSRTSRTQGHRLGAS